MSVTNAYKLGKQVTSFIAFSFAWAALIMAGPILQACGVIGG